MGGKGELGIWGAIGVDLSTLLWLDVYDCFFTLLSTTLVCYLNGFLVYPRKRYALDAIRAVYETLQGLCTLFTRVHSSYLVHCS